MPVALGGRSFPAFSSETVFSRTLGPLGLELEENLHEVPLSGEASVL